MRVLLSLAIAALLPACGYPTVQSRSPGPGLPSAAAPPRPTELVAALPSLVVATGSTVVMTQDASRTRFATPRAGLPLAVIATSDDGRDVVVRITGGIELTGIVTRDNLGALVCDPGPIGDRYYAGIGNLVSLRSPVSADRVTVAGNVVLPAGPGSRSGLHRIPFEASIDERRLCKAVPAPKHAGTMDDPQVLRRAGEVDEDDFAPGTPIIDVDEEVSLTLLAAPGGAPLYTHPAEEASYSLMVVERRGEWRLVAAGSGPYLLGWIAARPERAPGPMGGLGLVGDIIMKGPLALHTGDVTRLPLHHLAAGTEVHSSGDARARLSSAGFARVAASRAGRVEVVAAVDDDVVIEGWIEPGQLGPRENETRR